MMKTEPIKIVVMMTVENIQGRVIISNLLNFNFPLTAIIVEHKSKYSEKCRNYLQNDFYNPKSIDELIQDQKINDIMLNIIIMMKQNHYLGNMNQTTSF